MPATPTGDRPRWLLLIHQVPPKPDYLRVKVRRRLERLGAVALKNSVYVLPATEATVEDFQWLLREIVAEGGEATLCEATLVDGITDDALTATFHAARDAEYREIAAAAEALAPAAPFPEGGASDAPAAATAVARLRRRLADVVAVDFLTAPGRAAAAAALDAAEARLRGASTAERAAVDAGGGPVRARTWVTRRDVHVDRIASAWLIRRFVDPEARFKFVAPAGYRPGAGELRFDMYEAEYTHEGERCTFETLLARFDLGGDPALVALAEIVHDIDLKDEAFGRPETAGVATVVAGLAATTPADADRIERGAAVLDGLYAALRASPGAS